MKWILALLTCISLNSCITTTIPEMHYSVAQNVPLLTQKGEARFSAATGTEGTGVQAAYAFSKSWAVMGSYSEGIDEIWPPGLIGDAGYSNDNRRSGELAIGYFHPIATKGVFEIYGGVERYYRSFSEDWFPEGYPNSRVTSTNVTKPFVQVDFGLINLRKHSFGLSLKLGLLVYDHFSNIVTLSDTTGKQTTTSNSYDIRSALVVEPCFTYRVGGKHLSFQAQAGFSFTNSQLNTINSGSTLSEPFFFNVGLSVRLFKDMNNNIKKAE